MCSVVACSYYAVQLRDPDVFGKLVLGSLLIFMLIFRQRKSTGNHLSIIPCHHDNDRP